MEIKEKRRSLFHGQLGLVLKGSIMDVAWWSKRLVAGMLVLVIWALGDVAADSDSYFWLVQCRRWWLDRGPPLLELQFCPQICAYLLLVNFALYRVFNYFCLCCCIPRAGPRWTRAWSGYNVMEVNVGFLILWTNRPHYHTTKHKAGKDDVT